MGIDGGIARALVWRGRPPMERASLFSDGPHLKNSRENGCDVGCPHMVCVRKYI